MKLYIFAVIFMFAGICFAQSIEEELKLLGGEDFIIGNEKAEQSKSPVEVAKPSIDVETDTTKANEQTSDTSAQTTQNQQTPAAHYGARGPSGPTIKDTTPQISIFDTAGVARESSIDFSRNLSEYRKPQRALLLSLVIPGAGQVYTKKYWRAGLYTAMEAGFIVGAVYFRRSAKDWREKAVIFAKDTANFSREKLETFYHGLDSIGNYRYIDDTTGTVNFLIYGNSGAYDGASLLKILDEDFYGRNGVGNRRFAVQGWTDAEPKGGAYVIASRMLTDDWAHDSASVVNMGDTLFGISGKQKEFIDKLDYSQKQSGRSSVFIVGIFVNHIASAADAFITAIVHNHRLLREESGEKISVAEDILSRVSIESDMYFDYKNDLTTKLGFVWRF